MDGVQPCKTKNAINFLSEPLRLAEVHSQFYCVYPKRSTLREIKKKGFKMSLIMITSQNACFFSSSRPSVMPVISMWINMGQTNVHTYPDIEAKRKKIAVSEVFHKLDRYRTNSHTERRQRLVSSAKVQAELKQSSESSGCQNGLNDFHH